jgi:hypothetical protein
MRSESLGEKEHGIPRLPATCLFLRSLLLDHEDGGLHIPPKRRLPATCLFLRSLLLDHEDGGATYSAETSVDFHRTIQRYIPEDRTLRGT